jgi:hypothetical protein
MSSWVVSDRTSARRGRIVISSGRQVAHGLADRAPRLISSSSTRRTGRYEAEPTAAGWPRRAPPQHSAPA